MKILIVDDDRLMHEMIGRVLMSQGCEIEHAFDTTDAMNIFVTNPDIDLVITDIVMPGEDGTKLIKQIKNMKPDLPVLAITGGVENAVTDYVAFANLYSDYTLAKPFSKTDLKAGIQAAIDRVNHNKARQDDDDDIFGNIHDILCKYNTTTTS